MRKISIVFICLLLIFGRSFSASLLAEAYTAPTPPPSPTAEPTPSPAPTAPSYEGASPTPPPSPTMEELSSSPTPTPTPKPKKTSSTSDTSSSTSTSNGSETTSSSGNVGDTQISTGDATNTSQISSDANTNLASAGTSGGTSSGVKILSTDNGSDSTNSGSVKVQSDSSTVQDNTATVVNNLGQKTETGDNSASKNVGDSTITTGDANTSGTIVTSVNTNVDGVLIAEFNVFDDHMGDIILDFGTGCLIGCTMELIAVNSGNGTGSTNISEIDLLTSDNVFQNNDATIENNVMLVSDSGGNEADKNTGGDSSITTGDANVSANILNFANNNLVGGVVLAVVNIFGDLVGDIIFPDGTVFSCCATNITAVNSGNGADSTNTATVDQTTSNNIYQFNNADIENNLYLSANTGDNETSKNTSGTSSIETGDANIFAQVTNMANMNLVGGNWWLVIVNEAGKWFGKIIGAEGSSYAGSDGLEFYVNEFGEIFVSNSGNGADSTNTAQVTSSSQSAVIQSNDANIVNNVYLTANTGDNSASYNTNGNSTIKTGDANIVANIVNFVNNNIVGGANLFVTLINVFGSWTGDFLGPGVQKESSLAGNPSSSSHGGTSQNTGGSSSQSSTNQDPGQQGGPLPFENSGVFENGGGEQTFNQNVLASFTNYASGYEGENGDKLALLQYPTDQGSDSLQQRVVNINLAWFAFFGGLVIAYFGIKKLRARLAIVEK